MQDFRHSLEFLLIEFNFTPSPEVTTLLEPKRKGFYRMPRRKAQSELTPRTIALRVVYFLENNSWVAQCLEYDVAAQGKTLSEVEDAFRKTITGQIILDLRNGKDPFDGIKPAPRLYWQKFNEGYKLGVEKNIDLPPNVPPAFLVEAITRETRVNG